MARTGGCFHTQLNVFIGAHGVFPLPRGLSRQQLQALPDGTIWASRECHFVAIWHLKGLVAPQGDIGCRKLRPTMQKYAARLMPLHLHTNTGLISQLGTSTLGKSTLVAQRRRGKSAVAIQLCHSTSCFRVAVEQCTISITSTGEGSPEHWIQFDNLKSLMTYKQGAKCMRCMTSPYAANRCCFHAPSQLLYSALSHCSAKFDHSGYCKRGGALAGCPAGDYSFACCSHPICCSLQSTGLCVGIVPTSKEGIVRLDSTASGDLAACLHKVLSNVWEVYSSSAVKPPWPRCCMFGTNIETLRNHVCSSTQ